MTLLSLTVKEHVLPTMVVHPHVHPLNVEFGPMTAVKLSLVPFGNDALNGLAFSIVTDQTSHVIITLFPSQRFFMTTSTFFQLPG
jgi:hypothetical protein